MVAYEDVQRGTPFSTKFSHFQRIWARRDFRSPVKAPSLNFEFALPRRLALIVPSRFYERQSQFFNGERRYDLIPCRVTEASDFRSSNDQWHLLNGPCSKLRTWNSHGWQGFDSISIKPKCFSR
jgi:hypothetical protein